MQFLNRFRIATVVFGLALTLLSTAAAAVNDDTTEAESKTIVLKDATIHSMGQLGTFVGSIVIVDGKIQAIGSDVKLPESATVYELKGFHVTPGLIESRGKLWLTPQAAVENNTRAELNVVDAIDPWNEDWKELAAQGITSVYVQQNSLSSFGGLGAVLRVGPHASIEGIVLKDEVAVQVSIGTRGRTSKDRFVQIQALEKLLKSAQDKKKDDKKEDGKDKEGDKDKKADADKNKEKSGDDKKDEDDDEKKDDDKKKDEKKDADKDEKKDPTKELFKRVLKREIPLFVEVHHSDALKRIVALAEEFKIRIVLDGLSNVQSCAGDLKDCSHAMVIGPFFEPAVAPAYRKNGDLQWFADTKTDETLWAISSFPGNARGSQTLRINAANAVRMGVAPNEALKAITSNAARILGVSDQVGSLEEGKQADIAVFAGDPTDSSTPARLVLSHGKVIFENEVAAVPAVEIGETIGLPEQLPKNYAVKTTRMLREGKLAAGVIVVSDGKITSTELSSDAGDLEVYDLGDTIVTPGLVIAHSSLGQAATISDSTESDATHLRAVDAFDPTTKRSKETLAAGFVHIGVAPGTSNTSAGAIGQVRLGVSDYVVNAAIANQFVLSASARNEQRFPASLNGQVRMLDGLLGGELIESRVYMPKGIAKAIADEKRRCAKEVAGSVRGVVFIVSDQIEMRAAKRIIGRDLLQSVVLYNGSVGDVSSELKELGAMIVAPAGANDYGTRIAQIKEAIGWIGFSGESADQVRMTASMLVAAGVPAEQVLLGLTKIGGRVVNMSDVSLSEGANADFVVWSGSPLNFAAKPLNVVVNGKPVNKK